MEGLRYPARVVALAVGLVAICSPAAAFERGVGAGSSSGGVDVIITGRDDAFHAVPSGHSASSCHWSAIPFSDANVPPSSSIGPPPGPEYDAYLVFCDSDMVGIYWLGPRNFGAVDTVAMAGEVVDHVPVDLAAIQVRPTGRAVTGIPSYYWVDGYGGETIQQTVDGFGVSVAVSIALASVDWSFGDGATQSGSLGEAWPTRSSVHHTYRDKGAYTVTVTITLQPTFQVNGGAAQPLAPIVRTATLAYPVDEVQAVRDR
ncbi:MAG: hypothetical protein QOD30_2085 [Actinomycetota bacterium]|nr:hypothetical protein [Actinomycetota bacterium]